jgi:hypothetical protein
VTVLGWGSPADVLGAWCWSGGLQEDLAVDVDDGDLVFVLCDQDVLEGSACIDEVSAAALAKLLTDRS